MEREKQSDRMEGWERERRKARSGEGEKKAGQKAVAAKREEEEEQKEKEKQETLVGRYVPSLKKKSPGPSKLKGEKSLLPRTAERENVGS